MNSKPSGNNGSQIILTTHTGPPSGKDYYCQYNDKGKVHPRTGHEGPNGEKRYSTTPSLTLALHGGGWSKPPSGALPPRKQTRYPS